MKRLFAALVIALSLGGIAHAAFGIFQTALPSNPNLRQENAFGLTGSAWQNFSGNYTPGLGSPAVSTADWYHSDGLSWMRPYDLLDAACGSVGSTIAAANGRYVWLAGPDHPDDNYSWAEGVNFLLGFSNDPGILPQTMRPFYLRSTVTASPQVATITAKIDNGAGGAGNTLTVTAVSGLVTNGGQATVAGAGVTTATISSQSSGTQGGIGVYVIGGATQNIPSQAMTVQQANYKLYQNPILTCNPDDVSNTFYISAEGQGSSVQHQQGIIKSNDLVTWTSPSPTHIALNFNTWSSYQRPVRDGVNSWHSTGLQWVYPITSNGFNNGKWTSTDGQVWTQASTLFNTCIPSATNGSNCDNASSAISSVQEGAPDSITIGAQAWSISSLKSYVSGSRSGNEWVGRAPIDANFNVLASPSVVKISAPYAGTYPGPTYLQTTTGYVEDGIIHYWGTSGFPTSGSSFGLVNAATYANGGGLWQQSADYYTEIYDPTAAAGAAPVGVKASCASSTATVNWITGILPTDTMRLYSGTAAGSQTTLVGDFSGGTATDTSMSLNAVTYYKLVYLNGGVEKKNRVVSTYCSASIYPEVNAHLTRASAAGADMTTCSRTFMDTFYGWLTTNGKKNNLLFATMPEFCIAKSGSVVTKVFDMGTTRLPRGGDYTPQTAGVTYNATGINSKPAWINAANAGGYYGNGRLNNIRRKTQITVFAAYQKPGTAQFVPLVFGEGTNSKMMLAHTAGTPGAVNFYLTDATQNKTATATITGLATDVHTIAGTYSATNGAIAYADAVAGTPQTGLVIPSPNLNPPDILTGQVGSVNDIFTLGSGNDFGRYRVSTSTYFFNGSYAQASVRAQMIFDIELTGAEVTSLDALVR